MFRLSDRIAGLVNKEQTAGQQRKIIMWLKVLIHKMIKLYTV